MAARACFFADTPLPPADRQILNRAARLLEDDGVQIARSVLSHIRTAYQAGMSAKDLANMCDPRT